MKKYVAEFFGTFWLVIGGCGSAVLAAAFPDVGVGLLGVSLAFGLTVLTMAFAIGHISGCHLNPAARGAGGAHGLMQMTPGAAQRVGVSDINSVDGNVQASARYLALIRRKFFASNQLNERERMAFVLAAYNLGPERVQAMRAEARRRGLNHNQWFFQVERVALEQVGMGPVSYVNSVNKYFLAFDRERETLESSRTRKVTNRK